MVFSYPMVIHQDRDGIWAEFPDLAGCQTFGDSVEEILENAKEALLCYIEEELEYSGKLPEPSNTKSIIATNNDIVKIISVTIEENKIITDKPALSLAG